MMVKELTKSKNSYRLIFASIIAFAIYSFSNISKAQQFEHTLDLDNFVLNILKNNPGVQRILADKEIAEAKLEASKGVDDALLSSSLTLSHIEPNQLYGSEANQSNDTRLALSYERLVSSTGTRFSLGYINQYSDRDPALTSLGNEYYQPSFTLRVTQPLLKNSGGIQDRLNIELNEFNLRLSGLNSQENLENYITQLATLYIDWYLAERELIISRDVYQQSLAQEQLTQTKVRRQVSEDYELLRARETREDYYSRWQQASGRYAGITQQIRLQMNVTGASDEAQLSPTNPANSRLLSHKPGNTPNITYLENSSRLKDILHILQQQQIILLNAKDNAQSSDLNLTMGYSRHGVDSSLSNAHNSSFNKDDYSIMLEYKYPLGNNAAAGNYRAQLAQKKQVMSDTQQRLIDAKANLVNLHEQSKQLAIAVKATERKIDLARRKLTKEKQLYRIGKLDLFELLKDQTSQLESRLNRERLFTQNLKLQLQIGELLDKNLSTYTTIDNPANTSSARDL